MNINSESLFKTENYPQTLTFGLKGIASDSFIQSSILPQSTVTNAVQHLFNCELGLKDWQIIFNSYFFIVFPFSLLKLKDRSRH